MLHNDRRPQLVQVDRKMAGDPWRPYEQSHTENSILFPWVPRRFYQWRWALMNHSPLCYRVPGGRFTLGELLVTLVIVAQMAWMLLHWAIDPDMRADVSLTGAGMPAADDWIYALWPRCVCGAPPSAARRLTHLCRAMLQSCAQHALLLAGSLSVLAGSPSAQT